jgi:hopanoid biosynthesis associated protein HpnK
MKKVIINADDFGLCPGVNEGIIEAHQKGVLSSATLMANMPGFEQAVDLAKANPKLGVGAHLNLVRGRPLSPPDRVQSLAAPDGRFYAKPLSIMKKIACRKIDPGEIERELRAQLEKILQTGLPVTHLDSEKHIHALPLVFNIVARLAGDYGIKKVRFIREYKISGHLFQSAKAVYLSLCCALMKKRLQESGLVITDRFYGISNSGRMTAARLKKIMGRLREGAAEIMVHPGFQTPELFAMEKDVGSYYINRFRERELRALTDESVRERLHGLGVQLINFNEL